MLCNGFSQKTAMPITINIITKLTSFLTIWFVTTCVSLATEDFVIGTKVSLTSHILKEERAFWIHLPEGYNEEASKTASYPVMFVSDGERLFQRAVAVEDALTSGLYANMPQMIIVGIINTDRSRDLTPSHFVVEHSGRPIHTTSGGAGKFLEFITAELGPHLTENYRTNGYHIFSGHSFGGLFAIYAMLHDGGFFNAYLAQDPSVWWDDQYILKELEDDMDTLNLKGKTLYIASAHKNADEENRLDHISSIQKLQLLLASTSDKGLRLFTERFENDDHGTVVMPAIYSGLRQLFEGIVLPVKEVPYQPELIKTHYDALSAELGFELKPDVTLLDGLVQYCLRVKQPAAAIKLQTYFTSCYPESKSARDKLEKLKNKYPPDGSF